MRRIVIILGRERDLEPGEFGLEFGFGGLGNQRESTEVLAATNKLFVAKSLVCLDEGSPAFRNSSFSSHKV